VFGSNAAYVRMVQQLVQNLKAACLPGAVQLTITARGSRNFSCRLCPMNRFVHTSRTFEEFLIRCWYCKERWRAGRYKRDPFDTSRDRVTGKE
jgi:hypothetical protein